MFSLPLCEPYLAGSCSCLSTAAVHFCNTFIFPYTSSIDSRAPSMLSCCSRLKPLSSTLSSIVRLCNNNKPFDSSFDRINGDW